MSKSTSQDFSGLPYAPAEGLRRNVTQAWLIVVIGIELLLVLVFSAMSMSFSLTWQAGISSLAQVIWYVILAAIVAIPIVFVAYHRLRR